jgi:hypothetical protein
MLFAAMQYLKKILSYGHFKKWRHRNKEIENLNPSCFLNATDA